MRCPGCSADVSALREFCPVCGTPMDAGIRESLQGARDERPAKSGKGLGKVAVIGAALLALGVATQVDWPWSGPDRVVSGQEWAPGPVTIEAEALHQAYADNPDAAEERFGGREMVVSGEFMRIVPDGYGSLDLRLRTSNPDEQLGIDVADLAIEDAKLLRPGQRVTVSCQGMGQGADELWVRDCAIQLGSELAEPPPAPSPPEPPSVEEQGT